MENKPTPVQLVTAGIAAIGLSITVMTGVVVNSGRIVTLENQFDYLKEIVNGERAYREAFERETRAGFSELRDLIRNGGVTPKR